MATIRPLIGKKSTTYRVEAMMDGVRSSKTFKRKHDAQKHAAHLTLKSESILGTNYRLLQTHTLSEVINEYLDRYNGKDPSRSQRCAWWREKLGYLPLGQVSKAHIRKALAELSSNGLSNASLNRYKAALSAIFTYADEEYDTQYNPARQIKQKRESPPIDNPLSEKDLHSLLKATRKSSWAKLYLFTLMAVHTGARRSEILSLRWTSIDFTKKLAYLPTSKNGQPRLLPLSYEVLQELNQHREIGQSYIFCHPDDPNRPFQYFDKHWYKALERSGLSSYRIHDLRHTTGTWLANANVTLTAIQQVMGHSTIQTTQRYIHHDTRHKSQLLEKVFGGVK